MKIKRMAIKPPDDFDWSVLLWMLVVTIIGAIASYAFALIKGAKFEIITFVCHIVVSGFAGGLMFFIASHQGWVFEMAGIACGIAGWSGSTLVNALEGHIIKRLTGRDIK